MADTQAPTPPEKKQAQSPAPEAPAPEKKLKDEVAAKYELVDIRVGVVELPRKIGGHAINLEEMTLAEADAYFEKKWPCLRLKKS